MGIKLAFLLPHAVLGHIVGKNPSLLPRLQATPDRCPELFGHVASVCGDLKRNPVGVVPVGLHGDGVPFNAQRTRSLELFSINMPAFEQTGPALRIPVTGVPKQFIEKHKTFHDICKVLTWSFQMLALGRWPSKRHDGSDFEPSDPFAKLAGRPLACRGLLCEIRGDWAFYKEALCLPGWQDASGCCWLCSVTPAGVRSVGADAPWRAEDLGHSDCMARIRAKGQVVCPLFSAPGVTTRCVMPDWLHTMDLGVGGDILGNIFWALLPKLAAGGRQEQVQALFEEMKSFYRRRQVESKFDSLTIGMLKQPKKPPKLRGKAAEVRHLIPLGQELAERFLSPDDPRELAIRAIAGQLHKLYSSLQPWDPQGMAEASRRVASLAVALESQSPSPLWRVKPKMHLMQELCERMPGLRGNPRAWWTYRDEDAGGKLAASGRRRGGKVTTLSISLRLLQRFVCRNKVA